MDGFGGCSQGQLPFRKEIDLGRRCCGSTPGWLSYKPLGRWVLNEPVYLGEVEENFQFRQSSGNVCIMRNEWIFTVH